MTRRATRSAIEPVPDTGKLASIRLMTDRIVEQFDPLQVVLFGSFARGEERANSDVDLLVVLPSVEDKHQSAIAIRQALADVAVAKDVLVTTPTEIKRRGNLIGTILQPALREGKVLFKRKGWVCEVGMSDEERRHDVEAWLRYAGDDLRFAESAMRDPQTAPRYVCFLAQQSAEKALKAILVFEQVEFPRTHNVGDLAHLLPPAWEGLRGQLPALDTLSSWAVQARYPDALRDASEAEAQSALDQARAVWAAVSGAFARRDFAI